MSRAGGARRPTPFDAVLSVPAGRRSALFALGVAKAIGLILTADGVARVVVAAFGGRVDTVAVVVAAVGVLLRAASAAATRSVTAGAARAVKRRLRGALLRSAVAGPGGGVGATTTLATRGLDDLDAYYGGYLPALVAMLVVPPLIGLRILVADWPSAVVILITIPLVPVFMALIGFVTRDTVAGSSDALARLSDHLVELARGLPVLVGLGRLGEQTAALKRISDEVRDRTSTVLRVAFLSSMALELISTISVAIVAVIIGIRLIAGGMTLEAGLIALILAPECFAPLRAVGTAFHASDDGVEAERRIRASIDRPLTRSDVTEGALAIDGLTIRHADRAVAAVEAVTLGAGRGRIVALTGPSGSGKSSVLAVLAGRGAAIDPGSQVVGALVVPAGVAYLPQHPETAYPTFRAELEGYGAQPADVPSLLEGLGIGHLIDADPALASPGEVRRLAFARVQAGVAAGATLVLLDEPTAHLDDVNADRVRLGIAQMRSRATVLLATHDARTAALADRRVVLAPSRDTSPVEVRGGAAATGASGRPAAPEQPAPVEAEPGRALRAVVAPVLGRLVGSAAVGAAATGFAVALLAVSGWLIVRASTHPPEFVLSVAIVGVRFFGIGRAVLRYAERLVTHRAAFDAATALRMRLWRALALRGPATRTLLGAGAALDALVRDTDRVRDLLPRTLLPIGATITAGLGAIVAFAFLLPAAAWLLAGVMLTGAVLTPFAAAMAGSRTERDADRARSVLVVRIAGVLQAADDLAGNGVAARAVAGAEAVAEHADRAEIRGERVRGVAEGVVIALCGGGSIGALLLGVAAVHAHGPDPSVVGVLGLLPLALIDPLLELLGAAQAVPRLRQVLGRVDAIETLPAGTPDPGAGAVLPTVGTVATDDLGYRYPGAARDAFSGVAFEVAGGGAVLVTGPSGSGKSTMLAVLLRSIAPTSGSYRLNAQDAAGFSPESVRSRITWCPQEGHLFDSTIRGNLAIARDRDDPPTDAALRDALGRAGLAELAELPDGLDTRVGPGGAHLSGGQRQRLAIARTLLAGSSVVLLDEPTAHLDQQAADGVMADARAATEHGILITVTHDDRIAHTGPVVRLG